MATTTSYETSQKCTIEAANSVYDLPSIEQAIKWMHAVCLPSIEQAIKWMHAVCGYPVKSTWLKAVKAGNFVVWPLLNEKNINKYYPDTDETQKGHMNQTHKNVWSTKQHRAATVFEICNAVVRLRGKKEQDFFNSTYDVRETIFSDQTGQFPTCSQMGNKYVMVLVDIDSNAILVESMKSREDKELIGAYDVLIKRLQRAGITPRKHVLDNEVSSKMKEHIQDHYKFKMELVPPGCHRRNAAEVAIRNFKAHSLSVLAGTAESFPKKITLNLLRQSNATPTISAYAHLSGPFDYNKMPLAPMGCEVQVHEKTDKRGTWAFHSVDGWYLNTSSEHYRVHNCHVKETKSKRLSDTVHFKHKNITNPEISPLDKLMHAIAKCKEAIANVNNGYSSQQMKELEAVIKQAEKTVVPRVISQQIAQVPRVQPSDQQQQSVPRVHPINDSSPPIQIPSRAINQAQVIANRQAIANRQHTRRRRAQHLSTPVHLPKQPPAFSTQSKTAAARQQAAPPASRTRSQVNCRVSRLHQPTRSSIGKTKHQANFVQARKTSQFLRKFQRIEQEVHQAMAVMDKETGKMLNYRQLLRHPKFKKEWHTSSTNKFGRLAQGVGGRIKKPTDTIRFIRETDIPKERKKDVTYGSFVCTVRPEKAEPNRTRFTAGGDKINYPGEVATLTAEMLLAKILFNSVISTPGARFMTMDISNFYLMTPLLRPEYIRVRLSDMPEEIIQEYKLKEKANAKGFIFLSVHKGMYGLPQAGLLANKLLEKRLNKHGYFQSKLVPGLWTHKTRPIQFALTVDDFGVDMLGENMQFTSNRF